MEIFTCKDKKKITYENGIATVIDIVELNKQKADIEKRLAEAVIPTDKELLEWAKTNYPMTDHSGEMAELERINKILEAIK